LSAEEQKKTENSGSKSAEGGSTLSGLDSNQKPTGNQAEHPTGQKQTRFDSVKNFVKSYRVREFLKNPKTWFEIVALFVVICYTRYAGQQANTMNDTLVEIRKQTTSANISASAAQSAALTASQTLITTTNRFRIEQRPIVWLTNDIGKPDFVPQFNNPASPIGQIAWDWHFTNYGRTPAQNVKIRQYIKVGNEPFNLAYGHKQDAIGAPLPPGKTDFDTVPSRPITKDQFNKLISTDDSIAIKVLLEYTDADGSTYETSICMTNLRTGAIAYCKENYIK